MSRHRVASKSSCLGMLLELLDSEGLPCRVERGGKHWKIHSAVAGQPAIFTASCTPGKHNRSMDNTRADARRRIRLLRSQAVAQAV